MSQVFLIEEPRPGISVTSALTYGKFQCVFDSSIRRSSVFKVKEFGQQILDRLHELKFDHENDYIVMTGSLVSIAIASIAIVCTYPYVQLLFYNATQNEYVSRTISRVDWKGHYESKNSKSDEPVQSDEKVS